jgi:heme exporter protein A
MSIPDSGQFAGQGLTCVRAGAVIFSDLSFSLAPGAALILRGPNGSGKSSLLRLAAGFLPPAAGELSWGGEGLREDPDAHRARTHFVGHLDAVKAGFSVAENLAFWGRFLTGNDAGVVAALERLRIGHLADVPARLLSAGQRRRLSLARLLLGGRPLWLLDEPTVALDVQSVEVLGEVVTEHRAAGGSVMAATHIEMPFGNAEVLDLAAFQKTVGDVEL